MDCLIDIINQIQQSYKTGASILDQVDYLVSFYATCLENGKDFQKNKKDITLTIFNFCNWLIQHNLKTELSKIICIFAKVESATQEDKNMYHHLTTELQKMTSNSFNTSFNKPVTKSIDGYINVSKPVTKNYITSTPPLTDISLDYSSNYDGINFDQVNSMQHEQINLEDEFEQMQLEQIMNDMMLKNITPHDLKKPQEEQNLVNKLILVKKPETKPTKSTKPVKKSSKPPTKASRTKHTSIKTRSTGKNSEKLHRKIQ